MSEEMIVNQCSPTMAGIKTGNIFSCSYENREKLMEQIRKFNCRMTFKGIRLLPVRVSEKKALIYMYRPDMLKRDLEDETAFRMLEELRYPADNTAGCVAELVKRLEQGDGFPHEIGLFLGYPSEDVKGFVTEGPGRAKKVGTWRVYGNESEAEKKFSQYEKCTRVYKECFRRTGSLDRLVVGGI